MSIFEEYGKLFGDPKHGFIFFIASIVLCFLILLLFILSYVCFFRTGRTKQSIKSGVFVNTRHGSAPSTMTCKPFLDEEFAPKKSNPLPPDTTQPATNVVEPKKEPNEKSSVVEGDKPVAAAMGVGGVDVAFDWSADDRDPEADTQIETRKRTPAGNSHGLQECNSNSKCEMPTPAAKNNGVPFGLSPMQTKSSRTRSPETIPTKTNLSPMPQSTGESSTNVRSEKIIKPLILYSNLAK